MRSPIHPLAFWVFLVAGCGGSGQNGNPTDMAGGGPSCATMGMDVAAYSGDAAGALGIARPVILGYAPDAMLSRIQGAGVTQQGVTTSGAGSTWIITFYSPSLARNFVGAFGGTNGHVGCQDLTIPTPPPAEPNPTLLSSDALTTAINRIETNQPGTKLQPRSENVSYGLVANGANPPHDHAWSISFQPWLVIVDDASNKALECSVSGSPCNP